MSTSSLAGFEHHLIESQQRHLATVGPRVAEVLGKYAMLWHPATTAEQRRQLAGEVFELDGTYCDPLVGPLRPAELIEHIETRVLPMLPTVGIARLGQPSLHHDYVAFSWQYVDAAGAPQTFKGAFGTDFVTLSAALRIQSLVGFFDTALSSTR
jgi:hypothetical protein